MKLVFATLVAAAALPAAADISLYQGESFDGRYITFSGGERNLNSQGFNDRASSAIVRGGRYEVCEDADFRGRCMVLRPGQYPSLAAMGLGNSISSVRAVGREARYEDNRYAPAPKYAYDYRRRSGERLYDANVTSVRAVYADGGQRCWVERQEVPDSDRNVPGAIAGAVIGGILGHQVGSGRGNDAATVGGALIGGLAGSQYGNTYQSRDVQHCREARGAVQYYDVTYDFRGQQRYAQFTTPPGATISVNENGEPRG
jgi:hypothetical protein